VVPLVGYDASWPVRFHAIATELEAALVHGVVDIAHVGSTSVPGLPGRPIIDVLVGLIHPEPTVAQVDALVALGYRRPRRRARGPYVTAGSPRTTTVHFTEWGSARWWRLIDFRDFLRADSHACRRYAELKMAASSSAGAGYPTAKGRFVEEILRRSAHRL
jgi:GrpB-like predicted nucleotidyltransferase (UPF0157 family)